MIVAHGYEWESGLVFKPTKARHEIPHRPPLSLEERKEAFTIVLRNMFRYTDEQIKEFWNKEERA